MERVTITAARRPSRSKVNPSFSGSLPGYPNMEEGWMGDEDDSLPLPDHFPEPYVDPDSVEKAAGSSVTLETGATVVFRPPQPVVTSPSSTPVTSCSKAEVTSCSKAEVTSCSKTEVTSCTKTEVTSCPRPPPVSPKPIVTSCTQPEVTSCTQPPPVSPKPIVTSCTKPEVASCTQPPPVSPKPIVSSFTKPVVTSCTESPTSSSPMETQSGAEGGDGSKEGIKRITDRYATPGTLLRNASSVRASDPPRPTLKRRDTLPCTPTPSITLTPSQSRSPNHLKAVNSVRVPDSVSVSSLNSRLSTASSSRPESASLRLPTVVVTRGSNPSLTSVSALSDASSYMSDFPANPALRNSVFTGSISGDNGLLRTSRYQSVSGIPLSASLGDGVTEQDVQQVEMFYRSHKSDVTVCRCLANLYLGSAASKTPSMSTLTSANVSSATYSDLWEFVTTGIPLVVHDSGDHHRPMQITIVLAEKGTGFVLWKDAVTSHSRYSCPQSNFHTLTLSTDANKLVGLSFDDSKAAAEFGTCITKLTAKFDYDSGTLGKKGKRKKKQESKRRVKCKMPKKTDISQPCCFQHITKLERPQITGVMPLPPNSCLPAAHNSSVSGLSEILRDRLSVSSRTPSFSSDISEACTLASEH
ncbi:uncharacterized protein LOC143297760 [Babylonia areolata]|uniref:uncharacterized protein LOC143297760 n=1 Tax=Babylonia areolata TaxID=304850 RepID=UPI003FD4A78D